MDINYCSLFFDIMTRLFRFRTVTFAKRFCWRYYLDMLFFITIYLFLSRRSQDLSKHLSNSWQLLAVDYCCKGHRFGCLRESWLLLCCIVCGSHVFKFTFLWLAFWVFFLLILSQLSLYQFFYVDIPVSVIMKSPNTPPWVFFTFLKLYR